MIEIHDIEVWYGGVRSLHALSATFNAPITGLIGPNGAGKTTFLNVMSGLVQPRQGSVRLDGREILQVAPYRRARCGIRRTFQNEQVVETLSVWDNVAAVYDNVGGGTGTRDAVIARALDYVQIGHRRHAWGASLNAYDRRMVEIARALVGSPQLIMMDEPGAGLGETEASHLREVIAGIPAHCNAQVLLIDHDVDLICATCVETLVLDFGCKIAFGPTAEVLNDPRVRAAYLGLANVEAA
jgi:ABC-type branched-subunit amino acid transport system ATPase component